MHELQEDYLTIHRAYFLPCISKERLISATTLSSLEPSIFRSTSGILTGAAAPSNPGPFTSRATTGRLTGAAAISYQDPSTSRATLGRQTGVATPYSPEPSASRVDSAHVRFPKSRTNSLPPEMLELTN